MTRATAPTLRPYQTAALDAIAEHLQQGFTRQLVTKATGLGKTITFARIPTWPAIATWMAQWPKRGASVLIIAHRKELLDQALEKLQAANQKAVIDIEQAERRASRYADIIIASVQTLAASDCARLKRLMALHTFRIVIVDEVHHSASRSCGTVLAHLGFVPMPEPAVASENDEDVTEQDIHEFEATMGRWDETAPKDRLLVGVTATPNRSDAVGLSCVFQTIAYSYDLKQAIEDGWLVPIRSWLIETTASLDEVRVNHGDFNQKDLARTVNTPARNKLAVASWQEYAKGRPTLAFTVDVAHAHDLARAYEQAGVRAVAVSGQTPDADRALYLRQYTAGQIDLLANAMLLTEGIDLPRTSCIIHAKPTKSSLLYVQMSGRGLRLFEGKPDCVLLDLVDVSRRHSLQSAAILYGLPPNITPQGKTLGDLEREIEDFREQFPGFALENAGRLTLEALGARARSINVWAIPALGDFEQGRTMHWLKIGPERFRVQYPWGDGTEILTVEKNMLGTFDVSVTLRPHGGGHVRQRTLTSGLPGASLAATFAEQFISRERSAVTRLTDRTASWRSKPATPKQFGLMRRLGVAWRTGMTAGEASQLIDLARARSGG